MPALTGLRGLCALWVLVYHAWAYSIPKEIVFTLFGETFRFHVFISLGWSGVQVLFVLSAFLLTLPYAQYNAGLRAKPRTGFYLLRRIARVFPAFHTQLLLLVLLGWVVSKSLLVQPEQWLQYLLMLFVPPPVGVGAPEHINGVWWTLPIELSFYLLLPLISAFAAWRWRWLLLPLCLLSMVAWRYYVVGVLVPDAKPLWVAQLPGSMDAFGLGMLGAILHVQYTAAGGNLEKYKSVLTKLLILTPLIFFGLGHWMAEQFDVYWAATPIFFLWTPLFNATVLILILNFALHRTLLAQLLGSRVFYFFGIVSYGVYLWHPPMGQWLLTLPIIEQMEGYKFPRLALLMFITTTAAATLSWVLVEKRAIGLVRKIKF